MPIPAAIGMMAAPVIQAGADFLLGGHNRSNQLEQQQKLTDQQVAAQKELGEFNQAQALEMWEKTNYDAQVAQMRKAGLNVGLMYKGAGTGGTTQGGTAGSVAGGQAAQAPPLTANIGMALEAALMQAQIKNVEADTKKKEVEAQKTAGVDTEKVQTDIAATVQQINNAQLTAVYQEYQNEIAKIQANIMKETEWELIRQAAYATSKLIGEANSALATGEVQSETRATQIKQIQTGAIEQQLRIATQKAQLIKTGADTNAVNQSIKKMSAEIVDMVATRGIKWKELSQTDQEIEIKKAIMALQTQQTEFNTSTPAQIKQWVDIITQIINANANMASAGAKAMK